MFMILEYDCPYESPLIFHGVLWPCKLNSTKNYCPKNYVCLQPGDSPDGRPKFLTASGIEQSYCCPIVPNIKAKNFTVNG